MSDEPDPVPPPVKYAEPPIGAPIVPVEKAPEADAGIVAWAHQLQGSIETQPGVELISSAGGSVHFRFRGQTFVVTVYRTS